LASKRLPALTMSQFAQFKNYLQNVSFLTEADCSFFEPHLQVKRLLKKEYLLAQDKVCRHIGFVNQGVFRMYYLQDGKEINTQFFFPNQFVVDYDSFLGQKPSRYFIQALTEAELVVFGLAALEQAYDYSHHWERFGRLVAEQAYRATTERVEAFLFYNAEQRYAQLLAQAPHLLEQVPLYHLASYLGLERESLSRLRRKLAKPGRDSSAK
jgi:CRP/FNR family transcriptional regulator, anaerobic regulatory protein